MVGRPDKLGVSCWARDLRRLHAREVAAMANTASTAPATVGMNQPLFKPFHQNNIEKAPIKQVVVGDRMCVDLSCCRIPASCADYFSRYPILHDAAFQNMLL